MIGDIQVDLRLIGAPRQLSLSASKGESPCRTFNISRAGRLFSPNALLSTGQRASDVVVKLKSELMTIMTAEIKDPNSQDIQGMCGLEWLLHVVHGQLIC